MLKPCDTCVELKSNVSSKVCGLGDNGKVLHVNINLLICITLNPKVRS